MKKILILLLILSAACKQTYNPPIVSSKKNFVVEEGFINNGPDSTYIRLSQTFSLSDTAQLVMILHAQVWVEGNDNSSYSLPEVGNGRYGRVLPPLNPAQKYRTRVNTPGGKTYLSDYAELKASPPIDSVSFARTRDGCQIYTNAHDPQSTSHYYRYEYEETWEFHSVYYSSLAYVNHVIVARTQDTIFTCWQYANSTNILLTSTTKLSEDRVSLAPLVLVPTNSWIISVRYSILVRQYVLTQDAYNFWLEMQKNSERLGSIFDAQPSANKGNIRCVTDSTERVIGYISGGTLQKQRIFITPDQIPNWHPGYYTDGCERVDIPAQHDSLEAFLGTGVYIPITESQSFPLRYWVGPNDCVDCRLTGTNKKPFYWP